MPEITQRYGLFLNVENPEHDARDALQQTVRNAVAAEAYGYHDVWLAEHHYSAFAIGSAPAVLLAQIAAQTARVRLGTGASLLALNDPVRVAEAVATLDVLSGGRMEFGVARGGPFPTQYRATGIASADAARLRMFEALALIQRLWQEASTTFSGQYFDYTDLAIHPRPLQQPVPIWLASLSAASLALAEAQDFGLMATPSADLASVAEIVAAQTARRGPFRFAIARFFHCEPEHGAAVEHGLAAVRAYPGLMQVQFSADKRPPIFDPSASDEVILADTVIGDPAHCMAQVQRLIARFGPHLLLLKPATHEPARARAALALFARTAGLMLI